MRIDDLERATIDKLKKDEKRKAEEEVYKDLDEKARFVKSEEITTTKPSNSDIFKANETPYSGQEGDQEEKPADVINEPRKPTSVQMKFTERMYPHLAARESHQTEPPIPQHPDYTTGQGVLAYF